MNKAKIGHKFEGDDILEADGLEGFVPGGLEESKMALEQICRACTAECTDCSMAEVMIKGFSAGSNTGRIVRCLNYQPNQEPKTKPKTWDQQHQQQYKRMVRA